MSLVPIKDLKPSNELQYEAFLSETNDQIKKLDTISSKLFFGFAQFIYNQIEYGIQYFGQPISKLCRDIERYSKEHGRPLKHDVIFNYFRTVQLLEAIKYEDKVLYDRIVKAMDNATIRFAHIREVSSSKNDHDRKVEIIKRIIQKRHTVADVRMLIGSRRSHVITYNTIIGDYIMAMIKERFLKDGMTMYMPFDSYEDAHGAFVVGSHEMAKKIPLRGQFLVDEFTKVEDNKYDGCFIYPSMYNVLKQDEIYFAQNIEDYMVQVENMVEEAFRVTKLNGVVLFLVWNKPLWNCSYKYDYTHLIYNVMDKHGDWVDTIINPLKIQHRIRFPNYTYRTILAFRKR